MKIEEVLVNNIFKSEYDKDPKKIVGIYKWGSRLYSEKVSEKSDFDFVVIVDMVKNDYLHYETDDLDIHFYSERKYKELLEVCDLQAIETYYQFDNAIKPYKIKYELSLASLRKSISGIANNSWVKAKKKMILKEEDNKVGLKSLIHVFRIIDFGIQVAKNNKISFYSPDSLNGIVFKMENSNPVVDNDKENLENPKWEYWNKKLKKIYNERMTEFRKYAPKN